VSQRREVSSIVALVAPLEGPPRLYTRHFVGSIHGDQVIEALRYFRRCVGQPLVVVWDGLPAHRARPVRAFLAAHRVDFRMERLPAYAPELNPEEQCNGAVKAALRNALPASVQELGQVVRRSFRQLGRRPHVLRTFFHHAGLSVK
jgi:transposase